MVEMRNGVLHRDGQAVFGLGLSYYPSYHPQKVPVPPEGDRVGEAERDLADMAGAGFNIVRMAALGDLGREGGKVRVEFPFVDRMIEIAEAAGLASMVRLQGYGVNLTGYEDELMLDQDGAAMKFHWGWFVRNCLNHDGILRDNVEATMASAAHFGLHPSVVSFQIYNEPAYPSIGYFDYNAHSIRAWRRWMAERGYAGAEEALLLEPPRKRPSSAAERLLWERWRLFHYGRMNDFLNEMAAAAKAGCGRPETLTCHMASPALPGSTMRGEDYFRVAKEMDVVGITHYIPSVGESHFLSSEVLDMAESAAACFGKHAWLIEYNGRTDMSAAEWERETYSAVGSGYKGILYYQWRADYPYADGPEPEGFGMLFNDRRKTVKYDRAVAMNRLAGALGGRFVRAEKLRSGVAVLFSENVNARYDALDNGDETDVARCRDRGVSHMRTVYTDFRKAAVAVDFVRASELAQNRLGVRLLLAPSLEGLAAEERAAVDEFVRAGGRVFVFVPATGGYAPYGEARSADFDAGALLARCGITPLFDCPSRHLDVKLLEGEGYLVACLVNYDPEERRIEAGKSLALRFPGAESLRRARFYAPGAELELSLSPGGPGELSVALPEIGSGGFVVLDAAGEGRDRA